jgi:ubiquinone/menaquinone biosynthesis C-methylase UbiE
MTAAGNPQPPADDPITRAYLDEVVTREGAKNADYDAERVLVKLRRLREPQPGDTILDIGCGTGVVTAAYARAGLAPTGVDVVQEFVEVARGAHPEARYEQGAAESLPFGDASFDFVTLLSLLEHVVDWRKTLSEAARVLSPGGVLLLNTTNRLFPLQNEIRYMPGFPYLPSRLQRRIYAWAMEKHPSLVGHTHLPAYHWFTYRQLARELDGLGLEPHSWPRIMGEEGVPARFRRFAKPISWVLGGPVPVAIALPNGTTVVAMKRGGAVS